MAFPTTLPTLNWINAFRDFGFKGPALVGGTYYVLVREGTSAPVTINMAYSSDPENGSWTDAGAAHGEVDASGGSIIVEGTTIHAYWFEFDGSRQDLWTRDFDTTTDAWTGSASELISNLSNDVNPQGPCSAIRDDGDLILGYPEFRERIKGTDYDRVSYSREEGAGWTHNIALGGEVGNEVSEGSQVSCVKSPNRDSIHFGGGGAGGSLGSWIRTLNSSNTLSTKRSTDLTTGSAHEAALLYVANEGGTDEHIIYGVGTQHIGWADVDGSGDANAITVSSTGAISEWTSASPGAIKLVYNPADGLWYAIFTDSTGDDLQYSATDDHGATWTSQVLIETYAPGIGSDVTSLVLDLSGEGIVSILYGDDAFASRECLYTEFTLPKPFQFPFHSHKDSVLKRY